MKKTILGALASCVLIAAPTFAQTSDVAIDAKSNIFLMHKRCVNFYMYAASAYQSELEGQVFEKQIPKNSGFKANPIFDNYVLAFKHAAILAIDLTDKAVDFNSDEGLYDEMAQLFESQDKKAISALNAQCESKVSSIYSSWTSKIKLDFDKKYSAKAILKAFWRSQE